MISRTFWAALALSALQCSVAKAQPMYGPYADCSGTVGASAAQVVFPATGTGAAAPTLYLFIQNNSTANQTIWVNPLVNGTATTAPPSIQLAPTASIAWPSVSAPVPGKLSVIADAPSAVYTCHYK